MSLVLGPSRQYQANPTAGAPAYHRAVWQDVSLLPSSIIHGLVEEEAPGVVSADFDSYGLAEVVFESATIITATFSVAGSANVAGVSSGFTESDFFFDGFAVTSFVGGVVPVVIETEFSSSGLATVNGTSGAVQGATYTSNGVATVNGVTGALAKSVFGIAGSSTVFGHGADANAPIIMFPYTTALRRRRRAGVNR